MPEPSPTPPAARTARLAEQAASLRSALDTREQHAADGGPEHDHGLHVFAHCLLTGIDQHIHPDQEPTAEAVAQLVLDAEPLREALALREDDATRRREVDWELHSRVYVVLTTIDLLSVGHPDLDARIDAAIRERQRARPFSESVAAALVDWPAEQRTRLAAELASYGQELPSDVAAALRTEPDA
ncbi:hypothetical protein [Streptomyces asiaticus]